MFRKIKSILTAGVPRQMSDGEARDVALMLLEKVCGVSQVEALLGSEKTVGKEGLLEEMARRVAGGEPVQYVLGEADFCGLTLHVESGVLIPRKETEEIVMSVSGMQLVGDGRVLDVCTGSGCIAIALAKMFPGAEVEAWDISDDALRVAKDNAARCETEVVLKKVNVLDDMAWQRAWEGKRFSLIVSNPPYICQEEAKDMDVNVLDHEPHLALFVPDDDPLLFYRKIAGIGLHILYNKGKLVFEINRRFGEQVVEMLKEMGYEDVVLSKDMFGNNRMVCAIKA